VTDPLEILVVSDATGATAEAVVTSALVQFGRANSGSAAAPSPAPSSRCGRSWTRSAAAAKVGFRMDLERQVQARSERASRMGTHIPGYSERAHIMSEIEYCDRV
jgi:regulator of PEP synthase PpsR (kinase-PPPase family)